MTADPPIRDAASVLVVDRTPPGGPAVLMGMRGAAAAFMPSKYVFPGGAVDAHDHLMDCQPPNAACMARLDAHLRAEGKARGAALAAAALRELAEETGLLIGQPGRADRSWPEYERAGLVPDPSALIYVFRAITPPGRPRRFDARFFMIDAASVVGDIHDFSRASDELSHLHWVALTEARRLNLPFITEVVLAEVQRLIAEAGSGPLMPPATVPFFDNASATPGFRQIV
ncbi:NUDIX domain-containing protein [uncultured Paracoccus sp.]|uniref:NUDIX domain-containing protein n=1 Tax=uncultured Paracoccus sp. TaxID=189685 RepID=UPI0026361276|nr:NUDIX domain-containing protein [uncultured Paracoccus sp.]